jgi:citrate synthase
MPDILFEITKDNLETGLRGVPVGYCTTSTVDPEKGLIYSGKNVQDLAFKAPEEVIYLLYYGKEPSQEDLSAFKEDLRRRSPCKPELLEHIHRLPKEGHPMHHFTAAILLTGMYECTDDYREDCLNLIAKIPEIVAHVINSRASLGGCKPSDPQLGYMENFVHMLNVPNGNKEELTEALKLFNILHYDHGGGNLSTFVGKAVASGLEDMYGSIGAAMLALAGPRHGRANQDCLEFNQALLKELGENFSEEDLKKLLQRKLEEGGLIFGFGHAVLRVEDPRATVIYEVIEKKYPDHPLARFAKMLRKVGPELLKNTKIKDPYPNVDAISGTLLYVSGFPYPDYFTVLFGLSRVVGISIQIVYERCVAREGKGTPIIRPKYIYRNR